MFQIKTPMLLDGATGTNLMKAGMPSGVCVEQWVLDHPDVMVKLQKGYAEGGSDAVTAPTFEANRYKLAQHGLEGSVADFNNRLVALTREAVGDKAAVAGNMAPTGIFIEPFGEETFDGLCDIFREQAFALRDAGVDYIACETFMSLTEARAALLAAKETGLPVTVTLTVDENGKTLSGGDVLSNLLTLSAIGADAVGLNCSTGPEIVLHSLTGVSKYITAPLIAKPNAGVPDGGLSEHSVFPEAFAEFAPKFFAEGIGILGGCCGTTPEHIAELRKAMDYSSFVPKNATDGAQAEGIRDFITACEKQAFFLSEESLDFSHKIHCDSDLADKLLDLEGGNRAARIVIANIDDAKEFGMNAYLANVPILLLGYDVKGLEEALKLYQGRAMLDSKSEVSHAELAALSKKYGAILI